MVAEKSPWPKYHEIWPLGGFSTGSISSKQYDIVIESFLGYNRSSLFSNTTTLFNKLSTRKHIKISLLRPVGASRLCSGDDCYGCKTFAVETTPHLFLRHIEQTFFVKHGLSVLIIITEDLYLIKGGIMWYWKCSYFVGLAECFCKENEVHWHNAEAKHI